MVCYRRGYEADAFGEPTLSAEGKLAHWLTSRGRCASLARDLELLEHLEPEEGELLTRLRVQYCAPLISLGRLIGMILMGSTDPEWSLPEENQHLLDLLSAEAALALESSVLHSQQYERIQRLYRAERLATAGKLRRCCTRSAASTGPSRGCSASGGPRGVRSTSGASRGEGRSYGCAFP